MALKIGEQKYIWIDELKELLLEASEKSGFHQYYNFEKDNIKMGNNIAYFLRRNFIVEQTEYDGVVHIDLNSDGDDFVGRYVESEEKLEDFLTKLKKFIECVIEEIKSQAGARSLEIKEHIFANEEEYGRLEEVLLKTSVYEVIKKAYPGAVFNYGNSVVYLKEYEKITIELIVHSLNEESMTLDDGKITLKTRPENLAKRIKDGSLISELNGCLLQSIYNKNSAGAKNDFLDCVYEQVYRREAVKSLRDSKEREELYEKIVRYLSDLGLLAEEVITKSMHIKDGYKSIFKYKDMFFGTHPDGRFVCDTDEKKVLQLI